MNQVLLMKGFDIHASTLQKRPSYLFKSHEMTDLTDHQVWFYVLSFVLYHKTNPKLCQIRTFVFLSKDNLYICTSSIYFFFCTNLHQKINKSVTVLIQCGVGGQRFRAPFFHSAPFLVRNDYDLVFTLSSVSISVWSYLSIHKSYFCSTI